MLMMWKMFLRSFAVLVLEHASDRKCLILDGFNLIFWNFEEVLHEKD